MAKVRYSTGLKIVAVAAQQIFSVLLVLFVIILVVLFQKDILDFGDLENKSFPASSYFSSEFQRTTEELLQFVELRRKFETDGSYDSEKPVNIWSYYNRKEVTGRRGSSFKYALGDLSEWSRNYSKSTFEFVSGYYIDQGIHLKRNIYRNGDSVLSEEKTVSGLGEMPAELQGIIVENVEHYYGGSYSVSRTGMPETEIAGTEPPLAAETSEAGMDGSDVEASEAETDSYLSEEEKMAEIVQRVIDGKLYELKEDELILLLQDMGMENSQNIASYEFVDEDYLPIESQGIWENFIKGNCSMEQMCNAYIALEYVLDHIGGEINQYKKCLNQYNLTEKGTNVSYWISKGQEDIIYTNIKEPLDMPLAEYGKKKGKYVFYQENDIRLETNVKGMEEIFYDSLEPQYGGKGNVIFVCVDTKFPCEDAFSNAKKEYNRMRPWIYLSVAGVTVSIVVCLICLIYLSMAAGRREGDNMIYLNLFDRVPAEILYILMIVTGIICFLLFGAVLFRFGSEELNGLLIMSGVLAFFTTALFTTFYLSFVRRIRAGVLWNQSILHWSIRGIGMVFANRRSSTKVLLWFGLHLLLCGTLLSYMLSNAYREDVMILGTLAFILLCGVEGVLIVREGVQRNKVLEGIRKISGGDLEYKIAVEELKGDNRRLAEEVNNIGDGLFHAVDDSMRNEHLKTDLITNVSHDIKTPLTSIINYVDLLKREDLQNERVQSYIAVLDSKSQRLKQLTEDLVEASKVSSGNIKLEMERINLVELVHQTEGEFDEKFQAKNLTVITSLPKEPVVVLADGRRIWRVLENLYNNVAKYAMENTRVYVDMEADGEQVWFSIKNISENPLNIQADELTERFIRGDISRSTEGSGLGLSIAKNLTDLMGGTFEIYLDGDLFKATLGFQQEPAIGSLPGQERTEETEIEEIEGTETERIETKGAAAEEIKGSKAKE